MPDAKLQLLFDKFEIIECLKKDAHTSVYLAHHVYLGKRVILKTLETSSHVERQALERFKREAKVLAQLDHPHIIKVLDFGHAQESYYISFEYFESHSLRQLLQRNAIDAERRLDLLGQILAGLKEIHSREIIHRDLKPENVLVDSRLHVKIADFGLALLTNESALTQKSSLVGTPGYLSPEQVRGEKLTPASDLFSLGVIAFEMFTAKHPFLGSDVAETINNILLFDETKLAVDLDSVLAPAAEVIVGLLRKNPQERFANADQVLAKLGIEAQVVANQSRPRPASSKVRLQFVSAAILVVAAALLGVQLFTKWKGVSKDVPVGVALVQDPIVAEDSSTSVAAFQPQQLQTHAPLVEVEHLESRSLEDEEGSFAVDAAPIVAPGLLSVQCIPWAEVYIDTIKLETTPLKRPISLPPGRHLLQLAHPAYPRYSQEVEIKPNETVAINVSLDTLFAQLQCVVYPWAEIIVDGVNHGQTPMPPIRLAPGSHTLVARNPQLGEISRKLMLSRNETVRLQLNSETDRD